MPGLAPDDPREAPPNQEVPAAGGLIVQLHAEEVNVDIRKVEVGLVRVETVTHERNQIVEQELTSEGVEIERVPIDQLLETMPEMRVEGDVTILPVVEEVLIVQRRFRLKEEVHIRRRRLTALHRETVVVLEQDARITRSPAEQKAPAGASHASPNPKPKKDEPYER